MYIEDATTSGVRQVDTFTVSYDGSNRITALSSPILKFAYTYSSKSFTLDLYEYGQLSIHEIEYINSSSYVDSTFQFDNTNDTTTEGYTYTGGLLTRMMTYNYFHLHYLSAEYEDQSHLYSRGIQVPARHPKAHGWARQLAWNDHLFLCVRRL